MLLRLSNRQEKKQTQARIDRLLKALGKAIVIGGRYENDSNAAWRDNRENMG